MAWLFGGLAIVPALVTVLKQFGIIKKKQGTTKTIPCAESGAALIISSVYQVFGVFPY